MNVLNRFEKKTIGKELQTFGGFGATVLHSSEGKRRKRTADPL